jgi:hypothetical protein
MHYAVEMGSDAIIYIYILSFINIGSGIQKTFEGILIETHTDRKMIS